MIFFFLFSSDSTMRLFQSYYVFTPATPWGMIDLPYKRRCAVHNRRQSTVVSPGNIIILSNYIYRRRLYWNTVRGRYEKLEFGRVPLKCQRVTCYILLLSRCVVYTNRIIHLFFARVLCVREHINTI